MKHVARRRFGQNFLVDPSVVDRLITHLQPRADDSVIEVGPGLGALTGPLLERLDMLTVVEIDRDLVGRLRRRWPDQLQIIEGDVLDLQIDRLAIDRPVRIVGNLPYNIGTPLLLRLLHQRALIADVHVMLQKEVVDRLVASIGTKAYGRLSVMMQCGFTMQSLFEVPPEAFEPVPKVRSAIVRLEPLAGGIETAELDAIEQATRLAFAHRRKTLRNNLRGVIGEPALRELDIDPAARAETLDLDQFRRLAARIAGRRSSGEC